MATTETKPVPVADPSLAKAEPTKITARILGQIDSMRGKGSLVLPSDYIPGNALNSAWLKLCEVQNMDKKPLIVNGQLTGIVTQESVANALLDYVIQGMNVAKNQGYFIIYGSKLVFQRSYFGDMALAKRIRPEIEFYYDAILQGDDVALDKVWSKTAGFVDTVSKHHKPFPRGIQVLGAYCGVVDTQTGENLGAVVMDMPRIQKSWSKSKTYKPDAKFGTHFDFPDEMAIRTVVRRRCKVIFNTSSDVELMDAIKRQDQDAIDADADEDAAVYANKGETLALAPSMPEVEVLTSVDQATGEILEHPSAPAKTKDEAKGQKALDEDPGY